MSFKIEYFQTQSQYILRLVETTSLWICDVIIGIVTYQAHSVWITRSGVCVVQLTWDRHMALATVLSTLEVILSVFLLWSVFTCFVGSGGSHRQVVSPQRNMLGVSSIGNSVLREKLPVPQLVKYFLCFMGRKGFITASTTRHLYLSWADQTSSHPPHPTSWEIHFNIILPSTHSTGKIKH